ncbi:hypothetical protein GT022_14945 [Agaribacter marinus]|uniref:Tad domain-containing protein n=1 Tax=Virgibacillus salarius TaxID=447199 RepID=A0A941DXQ0_9BACI|nr:Tad domain-containing protein [Virgibacillus salarius]MBR7797336.1 Tad domain-containing protein [Virgibacillus salarius]NAZ10046.1 hypothetical protein [Agaribacter marinus]
MKQFIQQEEGNIALFVLGMLSIIMILFLLVVNMGGVLATKEKSSTTVQQASMAGSSIIYEEVQKIIETYEYETLQGELLSFFEDFDENLQERTEQLASRNYYRDWSANEIHLEALDQVVNEALQHEMIRPKLIELLQDVDIESQVVAKVKEIIIDNGGVLENAKLKISEDRLFVRAANEIEAVSYDG